MSDKPKARPARRRKIINLDVDVATNDQPVTSINDLVSDAMAIIAHELRHYRSKTSRGANLDLKEARVVSNYLDTLTRANKEAREAARQHDLSNLSNEELMQLASQVLEAPKSPKSDKDQE